MVQKRDKVLSVSRRTDIPAFYLDWFMTQIDLGYFNVTNPFNNTTRTINVSKENIHSIVFWSKNYERFIKKKAGDALNRLGFHLYFNFTINSTSDLLEPGLPSLKKRLDQLRILSEEFGSRSISWRFDPICFFRMNHKGPLKNNLCDFQHISEKAALLKIKKCVTSFFDPYRKIEKRLDRLSRVHHQKIRFVIPSPEKKKQVIQRMETHLREKGLDLYLCCEKDLYTNLKPDTTVKQNSCIDGHLLRRLYGGTPDIQKDYGQRSKQGCQCTRSIDIGSYDMHPCSHNCIFCYANPEIDTTLKKAEKQ